MTVMIPFRLFVQYFECSFVQTCMSLRIFFPACDQVVIQYDRCGKIIECMYNLAASVDNWFLMNLNLLGFSLTVGVNR